MACVGVGEGEGNEERGENDAGVAWLAERETPKAAARAVICALADDQRDAGAWRHERTNQRSKASPRSCPRVEGGKTGS